VLILHSSRTHSGTIFPFILKEADRLSDAFNPGIHLQLTLTTRLLLPRRQSFVGRTPEASQTRGSWRTTSTRRRPPSAQPPCCFPHGDRQGRTCNPHFGLKTSGDIFSRLKKEPKPKIQAALREVRRGGSNATTPQEHVRPTHPDRASPRDIQKAKPLLKVPQTFSSFADIVRRLRQRVSSFKAELQHRVFEQPPRQPPKAQATQAGATSRQTTTSGSPFPARLPASGTFYVDFPRTPDLSPGRPGARSIALKLNGQEERAFARGDVQAARPAGRPDHRRAR
jgi:Sec-independent protein translocase protein TatA